MQAIIALIQDIIIEEVIEQLRHQNQRGERTDHTECTEREILMVILVSRVLDQRREINQLFAACDTHKQAY